MASQTDVGVALIHFGKMIKMPLGTVDVFGDPLVADVYREQHVDADGPSIRVMVSGEDIGP